MSASKGLTGQSSLLKCAAVLAILSVALIPPQFVIFALSPPLTTGEGFLEHFLANPLLGLLNLDLPLVLNYAIVLVVYLGLFFLLIRHQFVLATTALVLGAAAMAAYFPTNVSVEMLKISQLFAEASSSAEKEALIAAADALLATWQGTGYAAFYIMSGAALLIFALAMRRSPHFKKPEVGSGIVAGLAMLIPSTLGTLGLIMSIASLVPWAVFAIYVAIRFWRLSNQPGAVSLPAMMVAAPESHESG